MRKRKVKCGGDPGAGLVGTMSSDGTKFTCVEKTLNKAWWGSSGVTKSDSWIENTLTFDFVHYAVKD